MIISLSICLQLVTRPYYDGQSLTVVNKSSIVDERSNGDYEDLDNTSHRIPLYVDSRSGSSSGSRIKLTNANLMYHSADKGSVLRTFIYLFRDYTYNTVFKRTRECF